MKKGIVIFIAGILTGTFLLIIINKPTFLTKTTPIKIQSPNQEPLSQSVNSADTKAIINRPTTLLKNDTPDGSFIDNKPAATMRSDLIAQIKELPDDKVQWVKEVVDQAEKLPVDKLFESEERDPDRAIGLEDKLRYDFYEQNTLNGKARIDSLECRSRYCKARIALPSDDTLNGAQNMVTAFPGVVLTRFTRNTDENSNENFSDIYIDTQPDSTIFIKIDDPNKP